MTRSTRRPPLSLVLGLTVATMAAGTAGPARAIDNTSIALLPPATRVVGLWATTGQVRPCGSAAPFNTIRNTLLFAAGGTVVENQRGSPDGVILPSGKLQQRSFGIGTWSFNPLTRQYRLKLRFDVYVDGVYDGYGLVDRTLLMSNDGQQVSGSVVSTRHLADGSILAEVCGEAVSQRL